MPHSIYKLEIGPMGNIIHVLADHDNSLACVFDPAWSGEFIFNFLATHNLTLDKIIMTHSHFDHINALSDLLALKSAPVYISKEEYKFYGKKIKNVHLVSYNDIITVGSIKIEALFTPGHTPGSVCYRIDKDLITGDTLFVYGCGTCSLPGGDARRMFNSLNYLKQKLSPDTVIHPGHGYSNSMTSLWADELGGNPFLHFTDEEKFVAYRLNLHDKYRQVPYGPVTGKELAEQFGGSI